MTREEAEKLYYKEEERKNISCQYITGAITVLSILTGLLFFFFNSFTSLLLNFASIPLWYYAPAIPALASVVLLCVALCRLLKSMSINHKYGYLPDASNLEEYNRKLSMRKVTNPDTEYEDYLKQLFIRLKDENEANNIKCRNNIRMVMRFEVIAFIGLILALMGTYVLSHLVSIGVL
jgi:hypothetical protein